jgi:hypothetical protein
MVDFNMHNLMLLLALSIIIFFTIIGIFLLDGLFNKTVKWINDDPSKIEFKLEKEYITGVNNLYTKLEIFKTCSTETRCILFLLFFSSLPVQLFLLVNLWRIALVFVMFFIFLYTLRWGVRETKIKKAEEDVSRTLTSTSPKEVSEEIIYNGAEVTPCACDRLVCYGSWDVGEIITCHCGKNYIVCLSKVDGEENKFIRGITHIDVQA